MFKKTPDKFFSKEEKIKIVKAIQAAEQDSSGEIRVHLLRSFRGEEIEESKKIFEKIGMTSTKDRNGVLFILGIQDRKLVVLGDQGIHEKVPSDFWDGINDRVLKEFKQKRFLEGLVIGIQLCGEKLKKFFPHQARDKNELSDQISH
jgi:uncharacterized membrane protein